MTKFATVGQAIAYVKSASRTLMEDQWQMGYALCIIKNNLKERRNLAKTITEREKVPFFGAWLAEHIPYRSYYSLVKYMNLYRAFPNGLTKDSDENTIPRKSVSSSGSKIHAKERKRQAAKTAFRLIDELMSATVDEVFLEELTRLKGLLVSALPPSYALKIKTRRRTKAKV